MTDHFCKLENCPRSMIKVRLTALTLTCDLQFQYPVSYGSVHTHAKDQKIANWRQKLKNLCGKFGILKP